MAEGDGADVRVVSPAQVRAPDESVLFPIPNMWKSLAKGKMGQDFRPGVLAIKLGASKSQLQRLRRWYRRPTASPNRLLWDLLQEKYCMEVSCVRVRTKQSVPLRLGGPHVATIEPCSEGLAVRVPAASLMCTMAPQNLSARFQVTVNFPTVDLALKSSPRIVWPPKPPVNVPESADSSSSSSSEEEEEEYSMLTPAVPASASVPATASVAPPRASVAPPPSPAAAPVEAPPRAAAPAPTNAQPKPSRQAAEGLEVVWVKPPSPPRAAAPAPAPPTAAKPKPSWPTFPAPAAAAPRAAAPAPPTAAKPKPSWKAADAVAALWAKGSTTPRAAAPAPAAPPPTSLDIIIASWMTPDSPSKRRFVAHGRKKPRQPSAPRAVVRAKRPADQGQSAPTRPPLNFAKFGARAAPPAAPRAAAGVSQPATAPVEPTASPSPAPAPVPPSKKRSSNVAVWPSLKRTKPNEYNRLLRLLKEEQQK